MKLHTPWTNRKSVKDKNWRPLWRLLWAWRWLSLCVIGKVRLEESLRLKVKFFPYCWIGRIVPHGSRSRNFGMWGYSAAYVMLQQVVLRCRRIHRRAEKALVGVHVQASGAGSRHCQQLRHFQSSRDKLQAGPHQWMLQTIERLPT